MKKLRKDGAPRMSITADFYDREVFEGIAGLAISEGKKKSEYVREVMTKHYRRKRRAFLKSKE